MRSCFQFTAFMVTEGAKPVTVYSKLVLVLSVAILYSFQRNTKDMVTDFDEKHDEYLVSLQQRNR